MAKISTETGNVRERAPLARCACVSSSPYPSCSRDDVTQHSLSAYSVTDRSRRAAPEAPRVRKMNKGGPVAEDKPTTQPCSLPAGHCPRGFPRITTLDPHIQPHMHLRPLTEEGLEAQKGRVTFPRSHSQSEPGFQPLALAPPLMKGCSQPEERERPLSQMPGQE